ncbi:MAG: MFS transporter [Candidatus Ranarchaeia archaeon]
MNTNTFDYSRLKYVFLISVIIQLGSNIVPPILPEIIASYGVSPASAGLIQTAFFVPGIFLAPFYGLIADRFGRMKVLVPSLLLFGVSGIAVLFASNFTIFLILRVLQGIGAASFLPLSDILTGDIVKKENLPKAIGLTNTVFAISMAAYPTIGGWLSLLDWKFAFITFIITIPIAIVLAIKLSETKPDIKGKKKFSKGALKTISNPRIWLLFLGAFTMGFMMWAHLGSNFAFLLTQRYGTTTIIRGYSISLVWIVAAILNTQRQKMLKIISRSSSIIFGLISFLVALTLLINPLPFEYVLISLILFGIGIGLLRPGISGSLLSKSPPEYRASVIAVNGTFQRLGQSSGPYLIGLLLVSSTLGDVYLFLTIFLLFASVMAIMSIIIGKRTSIGKEQN